MHEMEGNRDATPRIRLKIAAAGAEFGKLVRNMMTIFLVDSGVNASAEQSLTEHSAHYRCYTYCLINTFYTIDSGGEDLRMAL